MNGWFQPQRFTRTLFTTEIFGSCSLNALDWKHRVGREQAISPALFRTAWWSAVISGSIYPPRALPLWTVELHYDMLACPASEQSCSDASRSLSLQARYYAPTNSGGGLTSSIEQFCFYPCQITRRTTCVRSFRIEKKIRLRYINTAGKRAKYPASKNNTRVEIRQYSRVWMRRSAPQYRFKGPPSAIGIKLRAHL